MNLFFNKRRLLSQFEEKIICMRDRLLLSKLKNKVNSQKIIKTIRFYIYIIPLYYTLHNFKYIMLVRSSYLALLIVDNYPQLLMKFN